MSNAFRTAHRLLQHADLDLRVGQRRLQISRGWIVLHKNDSPVVTLALS